MKSNLVQIVFALAVLFIGAALEELMPKPLGVGLPILLVAAQYWAVKTDWLRAIFFAIAAGAMEDAISSLPLASSVAYFTLTALVVRWSDLPRVATAVTYPLYQLWLSLWISDLGGGVFNRLLLSAPVGVFAAYAVVWVVDGARRKAGADE